MENIRKQEETLVSVMTEASVQRDRVQCLSRWTPVSDVTESSVCPPPLALTRRCQRCFRELPLSAFYTKDRQHTPDSYCKECRKVANRMRRKGKVCLPEAEDIPPSYPVITRIEEPEVRMSLILHALQTVRECITRKYEMQREQEFLRERIHTPKITH